MFKELSEGTNSRRDCRTRWNGYYRMIQWACTPHQKHAIQQWCIDYQDIMAGDILTKDDWEKLVIIRDFLEPFNLVTKACEGLEDSIELVLPTMDFCLSHLERAKIRFADDTFMIRGIEVAWEKLEKYYSLTDDSPVYALATVLNPTKKWQYFEGAWHGLDNGRHRGIIARTKRRAWNFWEANYQPAPEIITPAVSTNAVYAFYNTFNITTVEDEYTAYITARQMKSQHPNIRPKFHPLDWWMEPAQRREYPKLSQMAIDLLSVPAMPTDVERLFSAAKLCMTDLRSSMYASTLDKLQSLKSWNKTPFFGRVSIYHAISHVPAKSCVLDAIISPASKS